MNFSSKDLLCFCELFTFGLTSHSHGTSLLQGEKIKFQILDFLLPCCEIIIRESNRSTKILSMSMCHSTIHIGTFASPNRNLFAQRRVLWGH